MDVPYGFGSCANTGTDVKTTSVVNRSFRISFFTSRVSLLASRVRLFGARGAWGGPGGVDVVLRDLLAGADDPLLRVLRQRLVLGAFRAERVGHGVVALEAFIRQQLVSRW